MTILKISGEVAQLFADGGVICMTNLISPYKEDTYACRPVLPKGDLIGVILLFWWSKITNVKLCLNNWVILYINWLMNYNFVTDM